MSQYLITLVETLALGGILTVLIARAFNNEKSWLCKRKTKSNSSSQDSG